MADIISLAAEPRERAGKGAARATRRAGRIPAVIYGNKETPSMVSIHPIDLMHQIRGGGFFSKVYEIEADGKKHRVLPRDIQLHPVTDQPIHVDFMRFSKTTRLVVEVPVIFVGEEECPGLRQGGVLNIVRHAIEMRASPDSIPESVEIDLSGYNVGDSVHISSATLPGDVELTITDRDFTVATIAAPSVNIEIDETGAEEGVDAEAALAEETSED
ncbi:MAG: 50S ribosomal protein L25/general stress protein Ctc [Rhodospirillales bacterium]|jgi:large subunit ribosomal protein L25|tara:strand:+ start:1059 stop:1706 length:648 start_codon:yes stop_codon:yes gene_type:complete